MLRAMLVRNGFVLAVLVLSPACKKEEAKPATLKKMDFKLAVDERGRMLPEISFFDDKHDPFVLVGGSYTMTLARPDGTILCSTTRTLAKEDYSGTSLRASWHDATCPPDPAADELRITLEVKTTDKPDAAKLSRDKTTPTKFIYRHLAAKQPPPPPAVDPTKLPAEAPLPEPAPGTNTSDKPANGSDKPAGGSDKPAGGSDKPAGDTSDAATPADKPSAK